MTKEQPLFNTDEDAAQNSNSSEKEETTLKSGINFCDKYEGLIYRLDEKESNFIQEMRRTLIRMEALRNITVEEEIHTLQENGGWLWKELRLHGDTFNRLIPQIVNIAAFDDEKLGEAEGQVIRKSDLNNLDATIEDLDEFLETLKFYSNEYEEVVFINKAAEDGYEVVNDYSGTRQCININNRGGE